MKRIMIRQINRQQFMLNSLKASIALSALDAISIGPIPLTWIAVWIPLLASLIARASFNRVSIYLYILILWAIVVQSLSLLCLLNGDCTDIRMPALSTTPYPLYIVLRFIPFLMLASVIALMLSIKDRTDELYKFVLNAGACVAIIALYVYFAQKLGLPDIPRSRLGTDGLEVTSVSFSYSFHRALGTFREPSGMAAWLILPFFLSLHSKNWRAFLIGGAILLSGSMSAFVAITTGLLLALIYLGLKNPRGRTLIIKLPIQIGLVSTFSFLIFMIFVDKSSDFQGLLSVTQDRLVPVIAGGIEESNRGYVFDFATDVGIPLIGFGLGNSNLMLTSWLGGNAVAGILSLYLNILMSLGIVGFILLIPFLTRPVLKNIRSSHPAAIFSCYGSYFAWLTIFIIHSAEFPIMFAVTYGFVTCIKFLRPSP